MTTKPYLLLGLALAAGLITTHAAHQGRLSDDLKEFEKLIGTWEVTGGDAQDSAPPAVFIIEADPGGRSVIGIIAPRDFSKEPGAKPPYFIRNLWYYDSELKQIVNVWVSADGSSGKSVFPKHEESQKQFAMRGSGITADGKPLTYTANVKWIDADTHEYWDSDVVEGGEKRPDSPKYTLKRIKGGSVSPHSPAKSP